MEKITFLLGKYTEWKQNLIISEDKCYPSVEKCDTDYYYSFMQITQSILCWHHM